MMRLLCLLQKCGLCCLLQGLTVAWQSESAEHGEGQRRWPDVVITQNACYINKLRSCFQFGPNYMVLTGHRGENRDLMADYRLCRRVRRVGLSNAAVLMRSHSEEKRGRGSASGVLASVKRGRDARVKQVGFIDKLPLDFFFFLLVEYPEFHLSIYGGTTDGK